MAKKDIIMNTEKYEAVVHKKSNRQKTLSPKSDGAYWCRCDRNLVFPGQRCQHCGKKDPDYCLKKETNAR